MATQIHAFGPNGELSPGAAAALEGLGGGVGGGSTTVQIGTVTLPEDPAEGQSVSVLADSETVLPEGITWDSGGEPVITERMLLVFVWSGTDWVGTYGPPIPAAVIPDPEDETPPTPGTLAASAITSTSFTLTVTGASDETALHAEPYAFSTDNGATWTAWQTSASRNVTGLDPETEYTCQHKVRDAALNVATGSSIPVETEAAAPSGGLDAAILALNPSVYLPFSETSGATVADASGNGHDATVAGVEGTDYEWADGLKYLTTEGRATIPHHVDLEPSASGLTLFAIVEAAATTDKTIAVKGTSTTREYEFSGGGGTDGVYGGYRSGSSWTSLAYAGGGGYSLYATYAVAMTAPEPAPAAYPTFYIDNDTPLQTKTSGSASWVARGGDLYVGRWPHVVKAFAMFPYELTATQVGTLMAAAIADGYIS